jgi:hypothetical protein
MSIKGVFVKPETAKNQKKHQPKRKEKDESICVCARTVGRMYAMCHII